MLRPSQAAKFIKRFDAYPRAEEHLIRKTSTGALVSVVGIAMMLVLGLAELRLFLTPFTVTEMRVDVKGAANAANALPPEPPQQRRGRKKSSARPCGGRATVCADWWLPPPPLLLFRRRRRCSVGRSVVRSCGWLVRACVRVCRW